MAKKKPEAAPSTGELIRNEFGYGILPAFKDFPLAEEFAPGAIVNGNEISLIRLFDDKPAHEIGAEWIGGNNEIISTWMPTKPDGEGWFLAMVCEHEESPFAVWARLTGAKPLEGRAFAEEFLLGSLIKAATKHMKTLAKPWGELKEAEQLRVLGYVHTECKEAVRDAIDIIAGNGRLTFTAAVDQVVFKDGVKAVLTLAKTPDAHSLADAEGSYVTIVIEERSKLLQEGDALSVAKDQKALFDASTSHEVEKETVEA